MLNQQWFEQTQTTYTILFRPLFLLMIPVISLLVCLKIITLNNEVNYDDFSSNDSVCANDINLISSLSEETSTEEVYLFLWFYL